MQRLKEDMKKEDNISFEKKLEKLNEIVGKLEDGDLSLKDSMENYKESLELIGECYKELEDAELKIEKIMKKDGKVVKEDLS